MGLFFTKYQLESGDLMLALVIKYMLRYINVQQNFNKIHPFLKVLEVSLIGVFLIQILKNTVQVTKILYIYTYRLRQKCTYWVHGWQKACTECTYWEERAPNECTYWKGGHTKKKSKPTEHTLVGTRLSVPWATRTRGSNVCGVVMSCLQSTRVPTCQPLGPITMVVWVCLSCSFVLDIDALLAIA